MFTSIRSNGEGREIVSAISGAALASYRVGDDAGRTNAEASARTAYNAELAALTNGNWIGGNPAQASVIALRDAWHRKTVAENEAETFDALYQRIVAELIADEYITE